MSNPVQGWYADPEGSDQLRWWDGTQWTDRYQAAPASSTATDSETPNAAGDAAATSETTDATAAAIGELAAQGGIVLHELTTIHASLEEAYLNLTSDSVEYRTDPAHQDVPQSQNRAA